MFKRLTVLVTCIAVLNLGSPLVTQAAVIGTLQATAQNGRVADMSTISAALARSEVRDQMVALGVEPAQVERRIAALTDAELRTLAGQMADMPAGGDALAIIGIVFLVLLILEAVGVIDIFKKFP